MHLLNGQIYKNDGRELIDNFIKIQSSLHEILLTSDEIIFALNSLSSEIRKKEIVYNKLFAHIVKHLSEMESRNYLESVAEFISEKNVRQKIKKEIGVEDFLEFDLLNESSQNTSDKIVFEGWRGVGTVAHIMPKNSYGLSFFAIVEGLITKNLNLVKIPKAEIDYLFEIFKNLFSLDKSNKIKSKIVLTTFSSSEKEILSRFLSKADAISCWGGDLALKEIQNIAPINARWIPWGHKISFIYISKKYIETLSAKDHLKIYDDLFAENQMACSAPQCIVIENCDEEELKLFAQKILENYKNVNEVIKVKNENHLKSMGILEKSEITNISEVLKLRSVLGESCVYENEIIKIFVDYKKRSVLTPSPLYFSYWLSSIDKNKIVEELFNYRTYLQTVGLYCLDDEISELTEQLYNAGALRIRTPGNMLTTYNAEAHDGVFALTRYMKKVSFLGERKLFPKGIARIEELSKFERSYKVPEKIMTKSDFQNDTPLIADLFFKSGGSSGKLALSPFSYEDYHLHMKVAGEGLLAAGLDQENDVVANLYFTGGLYGGFLSFFSILEILKVPQYPFAAWMDFEYVANVIVDRKINTLMGMPSYLLQLFSSQKELFTKNKVVKKIFYGGEQFSNAQINKLKIEFGVETIKSGAYGSVDAGPLGFQCEYSDDSIHHLNITQKLQILKLDQNEVVCSNEVGRLIFTSRFRNSIPIENYEIGDLGHWVEGACLCGRNSPRFKLMGRMGDIFRAGGTFFNYNLFAKILSDKFNLCSEFQIEISRSINIDLLKLIMEKSEYSSDEIKKGIIDSYKDLRDSCVLEKTLDFEILIKAQEDLSRLAGSGKLKRVTDLRL